MKPTTMSAIIVAILVLIGGVTFIVSRDSSETAETTDLTNSINVPSSNETATAANDTTEEQVETISESVVASHNTESDCWTIVSGSVYDITAYVPRHPGGDEVLRACGADGTTLFTERTTEDGEAVGSGTSHSSNAASQLADFKIGDLEI